MLNSAATRVPSTLAERLAAVITWLRTRAMEPVSTGRDVTPIWALEAMGDYRMTSCATCGEIVDPLWRLCQHCGNPTR